jgi:hypothetical protein
VIPAPTTPDRIKRTQRLEGLFNECRLKRQLTASDSVSTRTGVIHEHAPVAYRGRISGTHPQEPVRRLT